MRGIAAARARQARAQLAAVDRYEATIAAALARALSLLPPAPAVPGPGRLALVLFCAEQGFAGAFSARVLDAAGPDLATAELFVAGTRGAAALAERRIVPVWCGPMPSHSPGIPKLAASDRNRAVRPGWPPAASSGWRRYSANGGPDMASRP